MSYQNPIFNGNLIGKANRVVMNDLVRKADKVAASTPVLDWGQIAMRPGNFEISCFLAVLKGFVQINSLLRWKYSFRRAALKDVGNVKWYDDVTDAEDDSAADKVAINLYELPNTATSTQDGGLSVPPSTVGPVGAIYENDTWVWPGTSHALVVMYRAYQVDGNICYFFSHPNPYRCIEENP